MKQFVSAVREADPEAEGLPEDGPDESKKIQFMLDDRVMTASQPTTGQLTFLAASTGRGQSKLSRFSSILNVIFECLDEDDQEYLEGRLLTRDPKNQVPMAQVEEIFAYLMEEWFGNPTQESSDSATSQPTDGPN